VRIGLTYNLKPANASGDQFEEFDSIETIEALDAYVIQPARLKPGKYRNVTGNSALALGLIAADWREAELGLG